MTRSPATLGIYVNGKPDALIPGDDVTRYHYDSANQLTKKIFDPRGGGPTITGSPPPWPPRPVSFWCGCGPSGQGRGRVAKPWVTPATPPPTSC